MSKLEVDSIVARSAKTKHIKVESDVGNLTILATNNCIGLWIQEHGEGGPKFRWHGYPKRPAAVFPNVSTEILRFKFTV